MTNTLTVESESPRQFDWHPQPDITAYELALCLRVLLGVWDIGQKLEELPPEARRHFIEVPAIQLHAGQKIREE